MDAVCPLKQPEALAQVTLKEGLCDPDPKLLSSLHTGIYLSWDKADAE